MSAIDMYEIRSLIPNDITVELPTCMYEMKNIHLSKSQIADRLSNNAADGNITAQEISLPDLLMIENRQKLLLKQLEELKLQLLTVKSTLKLEQPQRLQCSLPPDVNSKQIMSTQLPDLLLRVNPKSPPYSLLYIQKLLRNQCQFVLTTHLHSNIAGIHENAEVFLRKFEENCSGNNSRFTANVRLIWKNLEMSQMESCIENACLLGEVNLLRYLSRVIPSAPYESKDIDEINHVLDAIYEFGSLKSKELNKYIEHFTSNLTKNSEMFLCGNELSIADIAAWSALKQLKDVQLNASLAKWMNKCENLVCT